MEWALSGLATRQHGVVATWQLLELGFTRQQILLRVQQGRLHRLYHGVYIVGHWKTTREARWMGAVLATGRSSVLSHRDAAALWELADFAGPDIEVSLPELGGRAQTGLRVHRTRCLPPQARTVVPGIPVTTIEQVMLDLASVVAPRHLRDAYVEAVRKELLDHRAMEEMLANGTGRRGIRRLRRIFELDSYEYHRGRHPFERDRAKIGDLKLAGIDVVPVAARG